MKISILLPYKENFTPNYAGAVSLFVNDITQKSIFKKTTNIFGNTKYRKYLSAKYINLNTKKNLFLSTNKRYVNDFLRYEKTLNSDLIEVHNRPSYINMIRKNYKKNLFLYFHNDPLEMSGSKSVLERMNLLKILNKILFNSEWSRKRFFLNLKNTENLFKKTSVCFQSSSKTKINFKKKQKIISFIGKLNRAKGYDLFGEAIIKILEKYPMWKSNVYGDEPREKLMFRHKNLKSPLGIHMTSA